MTAVYHGARSDSPEPALTDYWAHSCSQQAYTAPQSTMLGLHPVIHVLITWITTHLPTPEGWMAELAMLADLYEMKIHYIFRKELIHMHNNVYH